MSRRSARSFGKGRRAGGSVRSAADRLDGGGDGRRSRRRLLSIDRGTPGQVQEQLARVGYRVDDDGSDERRARVELVRAIGLVD